MSRLHLHPESHGQNPDIQNGAQNRKGAHNLPESTGSSPHVGSSSTNARPNQWRSGYTDRKNGQIASFIVLRVMAFSAVSQRAPSSALLDVRTTARLRHPPTTTTALVRALLIAIGNPAADIGTTIRVSGGILASASATRPVCALAQKRKMEWASAVRGADARS